MLWLGDKSLNRTFAEEEKEDFDPKEIQDLLNEDTTSVPDDDEGK